MPSSFDLSNAPLEVNDFENVDACSAYFPKRGIDLLSEDVIQIAPLNKSNSLVE
jgi:hypothetical protein